MLSSRPVSLIQENNDYTRFAASKTPGRTLKGRAGLQENVLHNGSMTVNPKEKRVALQTPLHQGPSKIILQDVQQSSKLATLSGVRPLGDKTPRPNRQSLSLFTPGPRNLKTSKLALPPLQDEPEATSPSRPPSLSRTKLRSPRPGKCFETPVTKGDYWNVSDVSIREGPSFLAEVSEETGDEVDDDSEPEYMPPKPIDLPYEAPLELPDYKEAGKALLDLAYSYSPDDSPYVYEIDSEDLLKGCDWSATQMHLDLPEFDDDEIFGPRMPVQRANTRTSAPSGTARKRTVSRPAPPKAVLASRNGDVPYSSRPATSLAIRAPDPRPASVVPRPGTSASNSRPLTTRTSSRNQIRAPPIAKGTIEQPNKDNVLAFQINDELEPEDDFRFDI